MYYSIKGELPHVGHIGTINTHRNILLALYYALSYFLTHMRYYNDGGKSSQRETGLNISFQRALITPNNMVNL